LKSSCIKSPCIGHLRKVIEMIEAGRACLDIAENRNPLFGRMRQA
jgi:hypothetical protein